jgi:hypothetical protein
MAAGRMPTISSLYMLSELEAAREESAALVALAEDMMRIQAVPQHRRLRAVGSAAQRALEWARASHWRSAARLDGAVLLPLLLLDGLFFTLCGVAPLLLLLLEGVEPLLPGRDHVVVLCEVVLSYFKILSRGNTKQMLYE